MAETRINKFLADCGICSRREADRFIQEGLVKINGQISGSGDKVKDEDEVTFRGKVIKKQEKKIVIAFYKPVGVTTSEKDVHAKQLVKDYIKIEERVTYAGRLDKESEGLLLLTNDGYLIQHMMKAVNEHEKEYVVKINKEIDESFLEHMRAPMFLPELEVKTRPCVVEKIGKYTFRIILTQGLNRQIRRMCKVCGAEVKQLKRIRIMNISLGDLKPGAYRFLNDDEIAGLYQAK